MQVTLTKIYLDDEKMGKNGKPYRFLKIQTQEHGERWISGFASPENKDWKTGDTIEIEVIENGKYLNYKLGGRKPSKTWDKINELDERLSKVEKLIVKQPLKEPEEPLGDEPIMDDVPTDLPW